MSSDKNSGTTVVPDVVERLRTILPAIAARLFALDRSQVGHESKPGGWSQKQELGHLIDSASNNHQRIVRIRFEDGLAMPSYDGDAWVELHHYQDCDWTELVELWLALNRQLLRAAESVPAEKWSNKCTIGGSDPITLSFVIDDYVTHMLGHLGHIGIDLNKSTRPEKPAPVKYPVNSLLVRRWSPVAFDAGRSIDRSDVLSLLEAARWAPSCFNEQPWRYLVFDSSDPEALDRARNCLVEGNAWAKDVPVLLISVARENFTRTGEPNRWAQHDVGLASENLVLQAVELGLAAHQMAGFDAERSRKEFDIPDGFTPMAMIAIGYAYRGAPEVLPNKLKDRDIAGRGRSLISEFAFAGRWGRPLES